MKTAMYSIYDNVAEIFHKPFVSHNDADAMRAFIQTFTHSEAAENKEDYSLWRVATWDDSKGDLLGETPKKVMTGFDIRQPESE